MKDGTSVSASPFPLPPRLRGGADVAVLATLSTLVNEMNKENNNFICSMAKRRIVYVRHDDASSSSLFEASMG